ncbi:MAG: hypothetical protein JWN67_3568 [Actinomycetia bacterium]|nr:hypothetical protein [Actinomycetes bacterium]
MRAMRVRRVVGGIVVLGALAWFLAAFVAGPFGTPACASEAPVGVRVDLRALVVTADATAQVARAWIGELTAEGTPYDVAAPGEVTAAALRDGTDHGRYQALIVTSGGLLTPAQTAVLDQYQRDFGVRRIDTPIAPGPAAPIALPPRITQLDGVVGRLTEAGRAVFPYLKGEIPIESAFGFLPAPSPAITALVETDAGNPLVATVTQLDGREELFVVPQLSPAVLHWRLLAHGLIGWASGGAHLGLRRAWLAMQVDDVFLPNFLWNPKTAQTDHSVTASMTPRDVRRAAEWSKANDFRLDLGFNAFGRTPALCQALVQHKADFGWFNHTYSHLNLDTQPEATLVDQIRDNVRWADEQHLPIDASELVTGAHTGLENPAMPAALRAMGIDRIASDASHELEPRDLGPARTVPRYPTNIYYDAATVEQDLAEYNDRYFVHCTPSPTTTCFTKPATWDQLIAREGETMLGHMLNNDPRTHYAHESNLAADGILYPLLENALGRYRRYVSMPLLVPDLTESGAQLDRQQAWVEAVADGAVTAWRSGHELHVTTTRSLLVPVTGVATGGQRYGGERSGWVRVTPTAPLTVRTAAAG